MQSEQMKTLMRMQYAFLMCTFAPYLKQNAASSKCKYAHFLLFFNI